MLDLIEAIHKAAAETIPRGAAPHYKPYMTKELHQLEEELTRVTGTAEQEKSTKASINPDVSSIKYKQTLKQNFEK